ncbi:DNA-directed RNA polymerase subunit beta' [Datura stramonium]|uniref:DNA-directed RNA polymerase subunit beta n=1 Tax=Datura stramonium TaxID=4076 RepID=A0ABS8V0V2_DATST|nr:DNA-directed RNA polymerase subunit beta' [Datura stramonium]
MYSYLFGIPGFQIVNVFVIDLRIIIENSLVEWEELGEEGHTGNESEDRKVGRRKDFLVRRVELAKHFIRTNIEPEWMVLCLLPVLPPELRGLNDYSFAGTRS